MLGETCPFGLASECLPTSGTLSWLDDGGNWGLRRHCITLFSLEKGEMLFWSFQFQFLGVLQEIPRLSEALKGHLAMICFFFLLSFFASYTRSACLTYWPCVRVYHVC
jgi:hypothetical protein